MSPYWQRTSERLLVNCFADEIGRWQEAKERIAGIDLPLAAPWYWSLIWWELLPSTSLTVPTRGELSAPTPTTFPLCKWFPRRKAPRLVPINSVRPPVWMHAFFLLLPPPTSSLHTSEKRVYFWCIALVFTLLWWGNRKSSYPINLYNPLWRVCFFLWWGMKLYKCMGNTSHKKVSCTHTAMGCLEWLHCHSKCIHHTRAYK